MYGWSVKPGGRSRGKQRALSLTSTFDAKKSQSLLFLSLLFHRELQLLNYQDLTQDTIFILLDLSIIKVIYHGKSTLILKRSVYVVT